MTRADRLNLPIHYSIDGVCRACQGAIKTGDERYRVGDRESHADCFDISLFGTPAHAPASVRSAADEGN